MHSVAFRERLRRRDYDLLFAVSALLAGTGLLLVQELTRDSVAYGHSGILLIALVGLGLYLVQLFGARQRTKLTRKRLKVEQESLLPRSASIPLRDICRVSAVNYPSFAQRYGEYGWLANETSISVIGPNGVSIATRDGKRYFVGSRRATELARALKAGAGLAA